MNTYIPTDVHRFIRRICVSDSGQDFGEVFRFGKNDFPIENNKYDKFIDEFNSHILKNSSWSTNIEDVFESHECKVRYTYSCHNYHLDTDYLDHGSMSLTEPFIMYKRIKNSGLNHLFYTE